MRLEIECGTSIDQAFLLLCQEAFKSGESAVADFNGHEIIAKPDDDPGDLRAAWAADRRAESERYWSSPEGQAEKARIDAANLAALAEAKKPLATFDCVDADAWASWVAANQDGYGAAIIRYAARWAALMEERLSASVAPLEQIAEKASRDADTEGITGFMYGAAVTMLSKVWRHGEALRRWHNISTQIGTEGEEANAKGGTLNPALLVAVQ